MPDRYGVSRRILSLTLLMFLLALAANMIPVKDLDTIARQSTTVVSNPERKGMLVAGIPHGPIAIDGDANFSDTALLEGWDGDGSPENPYIIEELDIDLDGGVGRCIMITNTRVSFIIRNCNLTGASGYWESMDSVYGGAGIYLENVNNGELFNNTCTSNSLEGIGLRDSISNIVANNTCNSNNDRGISLYNSDFNAVMNNTCTDNTFIGIHLWYSNSNTVTDNTCTSSALEGIDLWQSISNTVANNFCNNNGFGISLYHSNSNTVFNNTCLSNEIGIELVDSEFNTVSDNTCNSNRREHIWWGSGIRLDDSHYNTVANNTCTNNMIGIYLIYRYAHSNTVANNTCNNNLYTGIRTLRTSGNRIHDNTCNRNGEHGIYLESSSSDQHSDCKYMR
ncbi:MAG: right-handed parallel beta-helix repeat-containing protein [Candidatus Thorarchaeota archaeon]